MDDNKLMLKYGKFYGHIVALGSLPFDEEPTIDYLGFTRAIMQSGYRDMKEAEFNGTLVDYLGWLATNFVISEWEKRVEEEGLEALFIVWKYNRKVFRCMLRYSLFNQRVLWDSNAYKKYIKEGGTKSRFFKLFSEIFYVESNPSCLPTDIEKVKGILP